MDLAKSMKKSKEPKELRSSDDILKYPNGDVDDSVLKELLCEAHYAGVSPSESVLVTKHKRVKGSDPKYPEYENSQHSMTLKALKKLYKNIRWHEFRSPEISEGEYMERKNQAFVRAAARCGYTAAGD
jgi:hypothetical protein